MKNWEIFLTLLKKKISTSEIIFPLKFLSRQIFFNISLDDYYAQLFIIIIFFIIIYFSTQQATINSKMREISQHSNINALNRPTTLIEQLVWYNKHIKIFQLYDIKL